MYRGGTLSLGPFTLPYTWLFISISLVIGFSIFAVLMRKKKETRKTVGSLLINALLIVIGIWKVSPLLFQWKAVTASPLLLLYLPGGLPGTILGCIGGSVYFFLAVLKKKIPFKQFHFPLSAGIGAAIFLGLVSYFIILQPAVLPKTTGEALEEGSSPGNIVPDFTLPDIDGTVRSFSEYQGKFIFLNFWATWCPPCKAEIPELVRFYNDHSGEQVQIIAVNLRSTEKSLDAVVEFTEKMGMNFPVLLDEKNIAEQLFQVTSVPTTFVINREGIILVKKTGSINSKWMEQQIRYGY